MGAGREIRVDHRPPAALEYPRAEHVVGMVMAQDDRIDRVGLNPDSGQSALHLAPTEPTVDEHVRHPSLQQRRVAATARTQVCNRERHLNLCGRRTDTP
jgi:hypothetical protein